LMATLGIYVATLFHEHRFVRTHTQRWLTSWNIFKDGISLVKKSRVILVVFVATFLVDGSSEAGRLFPKQLVDIGFPAHITPVVWLTALSVVTLLVGIPALRIVEARVHKLNVARIDYALAGLVGVVGLIILAMAPSAIVGSAGILLFSGIAVPLTSTLASIQVNRATSDNVRATVHSFLAQAEYLGEVFCGFGIGLIAKATNLPGALVACAALMGAASLIMLRKHPDRVVKTSD